LLKKSFIIVLIQLVGSVLGLVTIYFVAGSMEPEVYSLVGVYTVISNIVMTFSDLGIETTMMREVLFWIENNNEEKVVEYSTQALLSRVFAFLIILPILLIYVFYMNFIKYNGGRLILLLLALVGAQISSMNNAMSLIVRSKGGYIFSQAASTVNNYLLKFAGLGLYFAFGANVYLYFYVLSSIPLSIVYFFKLRHTLDIKYIKLKFMLKKVYTARFLWLKTDLDYVKNSADSLLVSALFPTYIMGSYTIFKNFEQLSKNIIEGFFDVLSQSTVKYKGKSDELKRQEKKIKSVRSLVILVVILLLGIFSINTQFFIKLVHLSKYDAMSEIIFCIAIITIIHLIGKYEINAIAFFASPKLNFILGLIVLVCSIISFGIILISPSIEGVLLQRIAVYFAYSIIAIIIFKKKRAELYTTIK